MKKTKIAIIGAGLSGLTLAYYLRSVADIHIFEKSRGVGGRMSTRYADPFYFDHGVQCFTARSHSFRHFLKPFKDNGIVSDWTGKVITLEAGKKPRKRLWFEPHLVANPMMNSLCKALLHSDDVLMTHTEIAPLNHKTEMGWELTSATQQTLGVFDWVISTAPPLQTIRLFEPFVEQDTALYRAKLQPCFSLMVGLHRPWDQGWIAAKILNSPLKWVSVNSTKPNRNKEVTSFVAHSQRGWTETYLEQDLEQTKQILCDEFQSQTGVKIQENDFVALHRWRYALVDDTEKKGAWCDEKHSLASTGDWCASSRLEEVWIEARRLAQKIHDFIT